MDFIGEKCVKCGKEFNADDDIVVCPECGSPHHRECYKEENRCANAPLHMKGAKWQRTVRVSGPEATNPQIAECPVCHYPNEGGAEFCVHCGTRMDRSGISFIPEEEETGTGTDDHTGYTDEVGIGISRPYLGFNPDEDMGGATLREVLHFVSTNTIYYIPLFKRMKDSRSKISFNILCFGFPNLYFANRKMWLWSIITAVVMTVLGLPAELKQIIDMGMEDATKSIFSTGAMELLYANRGILSGITELSGIADILIRVVLCLLGNWMYYRHSIKTISRLKKRYNGDITKERAAAAGGIKPLNILLAALIMMAMKFVSLIAVIVMIESAVMIQQMV